MVTALILERILDTYDLTEIFELNDLTEVEVLQYLVNQEFIELPSPLPVDLDD